MSPEIRNIYYFKDYIPFGSRRGASGVVVNAVGLWNWYLHCKQNTAYFWPRQGKYNWHWPKVLLCFRCSLPPTTTKTPHLQKTNKESNLFGSVFSRKRGKKKRKKKKKKTKTKLKIWWEKWRSLKLKDGYSMTLDCRDDLLKYLLLLLESREWEYVQKHLRRSPLFIYFLT